MTSSFPDEPVFVGPFQFTVPAQVPGLLVDRACAPIVVVQGEGSGRSGVLLHILGHRAAIALHALPREAPVNIVLRPLDHLALQLSVGAGRLLALEWLARRMALPLRSLNSHEGIMSNIDPTSGISPITTDLIGVRCSHANGSGRILGVIRGVFVHRNSANAPCAGYLIEDDTGTVHCRHVGVLQLIRADAESSEPTHD